MPRDTSGLRRGGGRPKGVPNKATKDLKEWAEQFFASPEWRKAAEQRMLKGKAPHLEGYLLPLIYGKPREQVEHSGEGGGPIQVLFGGRHKP